MAESNLPPIVITAAVRHYEAVPGARASLEMSKVIGEDAGRFIVRVVDARHRPVKRTWYLVQPDGSVTGKLSFDDVQRFGEQRLK